MRFLPLPLLALIAAAYAQNSGDVTDYAPTTGLPCPNVTTDPLIRVFTPQTQALHPEELAYINNRTTSVLPNAWADWLGDGSAIGYNLSAFAGKFPKISISVSGGGYRAAQYGAGVVSAIDARNESAKAAGTGGLLQVASYFAGLSGGSWLTGSLYLNNWPNISDLVYGNGNDLTGWKLDLDLAAPNGINILDDDNQAFYGAIIESVVAKGKKGIDTSITDPWARMISYHFLNGTTRQNFYQNNTPHGAGQYWSHIPLTPMYQQFLAPFPILVADSRRVGDNSTNTTALNSTVFEITPLEFGSWDPSLSAMTNLTYIGTHLTNGVPDNSTACVNGFDQAGYMMGTSASLFNAFVDTAENALDNFDNFDSQGLLYVLGRQLQDVDTRADDVANWPNPFQNISASTFQDTNQDYLQLIDGGLNLENVPLGPMFVKARGMDFIVAVDSSFDTTDTWPNATALVTTAQRLSTILQSSHQQFPPIPSNQDQFVSTGANARPTFFGCDPTQNPPEWPLVLYLPNAPPFDGSQPSTNTPTLKLDYTLKLTEIFLDQVHNNTIAGFVPNTNNADPNWGKCLQCGAIDRARYKTTPVTNRSDFCTTCLKQYCFDPQNPPSVSELPNRVLTFHDPDPQGVAKVESFFKRQEGPILGGSIAGAVVLVALIAFFLWRRNRKMKARYRAVAAMHHDDGENLQMQQAGMHSRGITDATMVGQGHGLGASESTAYVPEAQELPKEV
ncbi:phospholipase B [Artomyces pyxidatus]|uniref:Phospholipase B n=1 Tax=Artomyces pyxidatus TaxID=48021 RepID=A0ACB8T507_9AGAM|nr:phospholipase B [Artomyces pyxidatus]